jgi:phosphate/sulfate permease
MRRRVRFGIRVPIFVNAAIFVFYLSESDCQRMTGAIELILAVVPSYVARRLVFETTA